MKRSIIKERPIGTIFSWRNHQYQVREDGKNGECACSSCAFRKKCHTLKPLWPQIKMRNCYIETRKDKTSVHYKKYE